MFRRKRLLAVIGLVILIPVVGVAWWLLSPLFTSTTVEEEFPFASTATVPPGMTMAGIDKIMAGMAKVDSKVSEPMPDAIDPESPAEAAAKAELSGKMAEAALFSAGKAVIAQYSRSVTATKRPQWCPFDPAASRAPGAGSP